MHNAPTFGEADAVKAHYRLSWIDRIRGSGFTLITALLYLFLAIVAASINFFDRTDPVYWWVMSVFLIMTLGATETALGALTQSRSMFAQSLVLEVFFFPLWLFGWVMVWWVWFRLRRPSWIPGLITGLTLLYMISQLPHCRFGVAIPGWVSTASLTTSITTRFLMLLVLLYIVVRGVKVQGREGWLALPAIVLTVAATFSDDLFFDTMFIRLGSRPFWLLFGMQVNLIETANLISSMIMFVLLLRRLLLSVRRQREMALDVMQAQEVQHVLLPESIHVPGLRIETEYRPAREVGGDFFQVLPQQEDGSVLIVAGDVTGKGLQAGMLVALLVGAIRSTAEANGDPRLLLEALNRRLLGRGSAHATCLAMRIESDGAVTLANAGHLAPYLNGEEVEMEGALPLGMIEGAEFPVSHFKFNPGDTLTLISDGVLEAQSKSGQLFGFDRVRDLLRTRISAAEVARAAQEFGQEDDISVVSVTRSI